MNAITAPIGVFTLLVLASAWATAQTDLAKTSQIIVTGNRVIVNDIDRIAPGMFGVHATNITPEQAKEWGVDAIRSLTQAPKSFEANPAYQTHLLGLYDRYQPALILSEPNQWRETLTTIAKTAAESAKKSDGRLMIEFWNEPFLNWSVRPGVNYNGDYYDIAKAAQGGPVNYRGSDEPIPDLTWTRGLIAVHADDGKNDYLAWGYMPREITDESGVKRPIRAGDKYVFRGKQEMLVKDHWLVKDSTQKSYWAGNHNVRLYNQMLEVFAPAYKDANPDAILVAGWDFHIFQGNWDAWRTCFKPTIDAGIKWIDGVDEHHYGGDTRMVAVSYEVAVAYAQTAHGKRIRCYNTEAGGNLDPQRPDTVTYGQQTNARAGAISAMTYHLRDVIYLLSRMPDKAAFRAAHEAEHNGGDEYAFKLLKDLRGHLLDVRSANSEIWTVASLNGNKLAFIAFNDNAVEVTQIVTIRAPAGSTLNGGVQKQAHGGDAAPYITIGETKFEAAGESWTGNLTIPGKSAVAITFDLAGTPAPMMQQKDQYFAAEILRSIPIGAPVTYQITIPQAAEKPKRAVLRFATMSNIPADIAAQFNGKPIGIPSSSGVIDVEIDPTLVKSENQLLLNPGAMPFEIASVSLILTSEKQ